MDNVLYPSEIELYVESMAPQDLKSIGSKEWLQWHQKLQKLNQQALVEASQLKDEQVKETLVTFNKVPVLIHEALCVNIWREKILPTLLQLQAHGPSNTFVAYTVLYHEAVAVALLELVLFHENCCETLGDASGDLLSYAGDQVSQLLVLKHQTAGSGGGESSVEELLRQQNNLAFDIGMRCLSIVRYLAENLEKLPASVVKRMYDVQDVPMLCVQMLQAKPWASGAKRYHGGRWIDWDGEALMPAEAQVWLTLRQLLLDPALPIHYSVTEYRRNDLVKLMMLLTPTLLDQLSPLIELKQWLAQVSVSQPLQATGKPILLEVVLEIKESILKEGAGKWRKIAKAQLGEIFATDKKTLMETAKLLNEAYNTDFMERFEEKPKGACEQCGKSAIQRCSQCKKVWYCSRMCQVTHWPQHKDGCVITQQ